MLVLPFAWIIAGALAYGLYLVFVASPRRAAERVLCLLADTVRLDLPLLPALEGAAEDAAYWESSILRRLAEALRAGRPFHQALREASPFFPPLVLSQIEAGLRAGRLPQALDHAVRIHDGHAARRSHLFGPFLYIGFLACAAMLVSVCMVYFMVPRLRHIAEGLVPFPVASLERLPEFHVLVDVFLIVVGVLGTIWLILLPPGRRRSSGLAPAAVDFLRWFAPGAHRSELTLGLAAVARHISLALAAGAPDADALDQAADLKVNLFLRARLARARDLHRAGQKSLADSFRAAGGFPRHFLWTVATGEAAGNLPLALDDLADDYEARCSRLQIVLLNAVQAAAVVAVGLYVGLLAFTMFDFLARVIWSVASL